MHQANLVLRPLVTGDIVAVENWLQLEHVRPWYSQPEDWLRELRARDGEFSFVRHLIACLEEKAIGFCQYYRCEDSGEVEYRHYWQYGTYSIDYLIGDPTCVGRGLGKSLVGKLVDMVFFQTNAEAIVAQPDPENVASRATLTANGFALDRERDVFVRWRSTPTGLVRSGSAPGVAVRRTAS